MGKFKIGVLVLLPIIIFYKVQLLKKNKSSMGLHEKQPELQGIKYTFSWIEDSLLEFKKNISPIFRKEIFLGRNYFGCFAINLLYTKK